MITPWKPMLAAHPDPDEMDEALQALRYPVLGSYKLDGIRAEVQSGQLLTRSLKPVVNKAMQEEWGRAELNGLDGEIVCGPPTAEDCFNRTTGQVRRADGGMEGAVAYVFDKFCAGSAFHVRLHDAQVLVDNSRFGNQVKVLKHKLLKDYDALAAYEAEALGKGYEGVCVRDPDGKYKQGRSTLKEGGLIAVKRTVDAEAVILAVYEQEENTNEQKVNELGRLKRSAHKAGKVGKGTLGGFTVAMYGDKKDSKIDWHAAFNIGTGVGLTDAVRAELWAKRKSLVGKVVKFRYQGIGTMNAPRQPIWLGFRDPRDM